MVGRSYRLGVLVLGVSSEHFIFTPSAPFFLRNPPETPVIHAFPSIFLVGCLPQAFITNCSCLVPAFVNPIQTLLIIWAIQKAMECVWTDETLGGTNWLKVDFSD
jgi:hypothetical protein